MKRIVSFDVDMTLLDHRTWSVPESALEALEKLRKHHILVLATGRDMDSRFSLPLKEQLKPDAIIHMNGTKVTVGDRPIYEHRFDVDLLRRMLSFSEEMGHSIGATIGDKDYYVRPETIIEHDKKLWGEMNRQFEDAGKLLELSVGTLAYIGNEAGAKEIEDHFPEVSLHLFAGKQGADVVEKSVSKARGLEKLCSHYGISMSQTIAFGDSMNDYEMIREAGLGIAMGNAMEELKMVADYVTDPVDRDGVFNACRRFHLFED